MGELPKLESLIGKEVGINFRDCWTPEVKPAYKVLGIDTDRDMLLVQEMGNDKKVGPGEELLDCLWLYLADIRSIECAAPKA